MIRDAPLIKAVKKLRSATTSEHTSLTTAIRHTNGREWEVFDCVFEQVGGAQSTLEG